MRIIILGAPGSGKGTQAAVICDKLNISHISTGDIFRSNIKNGTELGRKAKEYIDKGLLVPDELTTDIVKDRLKQDDCKTGFVLDGFPRTIPQADFLEEALNGLDMKLHAALNIQVDDEEIIKRLSGRRVCPNCGASYHLIFKPVKAEGICDSCKTAIVQRDDDKEETVINRLKTYHVQTEQLLEYYSKKGILKTALGKDEVAHTTEEVLKVLGIV